MTGPARDWSGKESMDKRIEEIKKEMKRLDSERKALGDEMFKILRDKSRKERKGSA